jgi:ABC-type polysaccharide/polyol phosphate export permease
MRRLVLHNSWPDPWVNAWAVLSLLVLMMLGYYLFLSLQRDFADHL